MSGRPTSPAARAASSSSGASSTAGTTGAPAANGRAGHDGQPPGLVLAPEALDHVRGRPDEDQARLGARAREPGVLGQEPVAGVDRLRAGAPRGLDQGGDRQVGLRRRRRADPQRGVGLADVRRLAIGVGVDGDRPVPERARRAQHADRDLAAVGDQDRVERRHHMRKTP
jgi:hypothetical protein